MNHSSQLLTPVSGPADPIQGPDSRRYSGGTILRLWVAVLVFLLILQPGTFLPGDLLDSSWATVLAHGLLQGKHWGADIVFTYGPLGFLTPYLDYSPEFFTTYLMAQAFFGTLYAFSCWLALSRCKPLQQLSLLAALLIFGKYVPGDVAWLSCAPLSLMAIRCLLLQPARRLATPACLLLVSVLPSLLPLIKASLLPIWLAWVAAGAIMLMAASRQRLALVHGLLAIGIPLLAWLLCRQSLSDIPTYLRYSVVITQGYVMGMGVAPPRAIIDSVGLVGLVLALYALIPCARSPLRRTSELALATALAVCVVVCFKASNTRADFLHTPIFPVSAMIILSVLPFPREPSARPILSARWLAILAAWASILLATPPASPLSALMETKERLANAMHVLFDRKQLEHSRKEQRKSFDAAISLPGISNAVGNAGIDVFSYEQIAAYANGLTLSPRPVFQGYSAYFPSLSRLNDNFYASGKAPAWIMFKRQSVDDRLPLEDDAFAVPRVLATYAPTMQERGYLLMTRVRGKAACPNPDYGTWSKLPMGEAITLPNAKGMAWWLRARIQPSTLGRFKTLILRTPALQIEVATEDGQNHRYRLLPEVASEGFIVSPALGNNDELLEWWRGQTGRSVKTIRIVPGVGASPQDFKTMIDVSIAADQCHLAGQIDSPSFRQPGA